MLKRHCKMEVLFSLLSLLILFPNLHGYTLRKGAAGSRYAAKLRVVEEQHSSMELPQQIKSESEERNHSKTKRFAESGCSQERLENMLRSCEAAAAATLASDPTSLFCGANCSHLVFLYASECSQQEFIVNISGACKLKGTELAIECVYAVVIAKLGITACTKMMADVDSTHDITHLVNRSKVYIESQCCSLQTFYDSSVVHDVYVDTNRKAVIVPPLEAPWLRIGSSNYANVVEIVSSDLCLLNSSTRLTTFPPSVSESTNGTQANTITDNDVSTLTIRATNSMSSLCRCSLQIIFLCCLLVSLALCQY